MDNRARVVATLNHERPDKILYNINFTQGAHIKMVEFYGDPDFVSKLGNCFTGLGTEPNGAWKQLMNITNAITIEAWVKINSWSIGNRAYIFDRSDYDQAGYVFFIQDNGKLYFETYQVGGHQYSKSAEGDITTDMWYHVAVTKSGTGIGSVKLYVNTVDVTSVQADHLNPDSQPSRVASINRWLFDLYSHKFEGVIDG